MQPNGERKPFLGGKGSHLQVFPPSVSNLVENPVRRVKQGDSEELEGGSWDLSDAPSPSLVVFKECCVGWVHSCQEMHLSV